MGNVLDSALTILSTITALAFVLLLAYVLLRWMGQKMPAQTGSHHIKVLDQVMLGRDKCLMLVRVAEKTVLVGMSPNSVDQICEIEDPENLLDIPAPEQPRFSDYLKDSLKKARRPKNGGSVL